jgi:ribosomal protein S11
MQQERKHKEMRRNTKTLNQKDKKSYLQNIMAYTTLPFYIKKSLNDTIMHLSTTTKNKLQRIKYNKV